MSDADQFFSNCLEIAATASASLEHAAYCLMQARERLADDPTDAANFVNHAEYHADKAGDSLRAIIAVLNSSLEHPTAPPDDAERRTLISARDQAAAVLCRAAALKSELRVLRAVVARLCQLAESAHA